MTHSQILILKQSDLLKCPFTILIPEHYRADGSCQCDDPLEQARMIREWGYTKRDFRKKGDNV